jgi:hypothetical protein
LRPNAKFEPIGDLRIDLRKDITFVPDMRSPALLGPVDIS